MVNHDIVRLDISVHDSHAVAVVQCSQELVQIVPYVIVCQLRVQALRNHDWKDKKSTK